MKALSLARVGILSLVACGGPAKTASQAPEEPVAIAASIEPASESPPTPSAVVHTRQRTLSPRPILEILPADRSMIFHMSWTQIESSDIFLQHRDLILGKFDSEIRFIQDTCGLDPVRELDSATLALGPNPQNDSDMIIALTLNVGRSQVEDCVTKAGGSVQAESYLLDGQTYNVFWPSDNTLLVAESMTASKMQAAFAAGRVIDQESLMTFLRKTDGHAALWGGGVIPASMTAMFGGGTTLPQGFHFSVNAWSGIDAVMGMVFKDESEAKATKTLLDMGVNMLKSQAPMAGFSEQTLHIEQIGNTIAIDLVLSAQQVDSLVTGK